MSIRKTGSVTGEIISAEPDAAGLVKEAASARAWDEDDERGLAEENDGADKDD